MNPRSRKEKFYRVLVMLIVLIFSAALNKAKTLPALVKMEFQFRFDININSDAWKLFLSSLRTEEAPVDMSYGGPVATLFDGNRMSPFDMGFSRGSVLINESRRLVR